MCKVASKPSNISIASVAKELLAILVILIVLTANLIDCTSH